MAHSSLGAKLKRLVQERYNADPTLLGGRALAYTTNDYGVQFHFRMINNPGNGIASSVHWQDTFNGVAGVPGIVRVSKRDGMPVREPPQNMTFQERMEWGASLTPQDLLDYGYFSDSLTVENDTHPEVVLSRRFDPFMTGQHWTTDEVLPSPSKRSAESLRALKDTEKRSTTVEVPNTEDAEVVQWNITAADVDISLATYGGQTQQEPTEDRIDIIGLSEMSVIPFGDS